MRVLKSTHETSIRVEKLFKYMQDNNLCIEIDNYGDILIFDMNTGNRFILKYSHYPSEEITELPPEMEYFICVREMDE